jgi:uridine phosphorylase
VRDGASVVEMATATLFALGAQRELTTGAVLAVTNRVLPTRERIGDAALLEAEQRLGELAVRVLAGG